MIAELLVNKPMWQIEATAKSTRPYDAEGFTRVTVYTFSDGSFLEVGRFGDRQSFLANGWASLNRIPTPEERQQAIAAMPA
jgi:hypothetical protein